MFFAFSAALTTAHAEFGIKEIKVAARTFGFIKGLNPGNLSVAIIHQPGNPASEADVQALSKGMSGGLKVGKFTLNPRLVPTSDLGAVAGADVVIVTNGLNKDYSNISAETLSRGLLTISNDFACVDQGFCVMGIHAKPKIEIVISRSATDAANISFAQALRLMVKER